MKHNVDHAKKALHLLYKRINNLNIPLDLQMYLFDHTVLPILLIGCEIWGYQDTKMIDLVHNQFLRNITKLQKSTSEYMLYAELGRRPLEIQIKSRMIGFWLSLVNGWQFKISKELYDIMLRVSYRGENYKWINHIRNILISVGKPDLINQPTIINPKATKLSIVNRLNDLYIQNWHTKLNQSSKGRNFSFFKDNLTYEHFLTTGPRNAYIPMIKFRTANFKLPIETGRWNNLPVYERKCNLCNKNDLGDECHFLFTCPQFENDRKELLKPYNIRRPNVIKCKELMTSRNKTELGKLSMFMSIIMNKFTKISSENKSTY